MRIDRLRLSLFVSFTVVCLIAQQGPVLQTSVHVVEVSVVATDSDGRTPRDLRTTDFRVWDNGKEQEVTSLNLLSSTAGAGGTKLPPNTYSNRFGTHRRPQVLSIILLDGLNTHLRQQQRTIQQVAQILSRIEPDERVGIFTLGTTLRTLHAFTSDRASLSAKLARYAGEIAFGVPDLDDLFSGKEFATDSSGTERQILLTFEALEKLAEHVKGVPGRKNLLWLSAAFPMVIGIPDMSTLVKSAGAEGQAAAIFENLMKNRTTYRETFGEQMEHTARALNAANVVVYPIDARGLSTNPKAAINQHTMTTLANATGGEAFYNRNDIGHSLRLALDDSRETYLLTYTPKGLVLDGAYHRIRVETARRSLKLRFRPGYYAPGAEHTAAAGTADRLEGALSSPLDVSDIGIRATVDPAPGSVGEVGVTVRVDAADLDLLRSSGSWAGALRIEMIQTAAAGETFGGVRQTARLALSEAAYQRALKEGLRFDLHLEREKKASAVRIGVLDERSGRAGSLSVPLPIGR